MAELIIVLWIKLQHGAGAIFESRVKSLKETLEAMLWAARGRVGVAKPLQGRNAYSAIKYPGTIADPLACILKEKIPFALAVAGNV